MTLDELEDSLKETLSCGFIIQTKKNGQIVILTTLYTEDDGELVDMEDDDLDYETDEDFYE